MNPSDEILRAILEADDDDDIIKDVATPNLDPDDPKLQQIIKEMVANKQYAHGKALKLKKTVIHTNPHGQTFCYGFFDKRGQELIMSLAYFDPQKGWVKDLWAHLGESDEGDEYKEVFHRDLPERRYIPFGTLVHATLREEDLIPAFLDAIELVDPVKAMELRNNYTEEIERADPEFCWETLLDELNRHVPPYSYFGAHIGNASDFGVWPNLEEIDRILEEKPEEIQSVPEGQPLPRGSKYIVLTDPHGSYVALLDGLTGVEIWRYD